MSYIPDPIQREDSVQKINFMIREYDIDNWPVIPVTFWHQGGQNTWDCGIYTLMAMTFFCYNPQNHLQTPDLSRADIDKVRLLLLNFIRYKYLTESEEEFDPSILFDPNI
jgi:hypothetical protein